MPDLEAVTRLNNGTPYRSLAPVSGRDLSNVTVKGDFSGVLLDSVDFTGARLKGSNFKTANFSACNLRRSDWTDCEFKNAKFNGGNLSEVKNAHRAKNLTTVIVVDPQSAHSFETVVRPWWVRLDWERMGALGRLPFFTASTAVLVLFPIFFYFLDLYNQQRLENRTGCPSWWLGSGSLWLRRIGTAIAITAPGAFDFDISLGVALVDRLLALCIFLPRAREAI